MTTPQAQVPASASEPDDLPAVERHLGHSLVSIHRVLHLLDQPDRASEVQSALRNAAKYIESARAAHAQEMGVSAGVPAQTCVDSEIVAVIAAAIAVIFGRTYKLVSVQPVVIPAPNLSAWAIEGRSQLLTSHRVR